VRSWQGWYQHIALVMVAMLFMLKERLLNEEELPLLSCADIEVLLSQFLPRRKATDKVELVTIGELTSPEIVACFRSFWMGSN